MGSALADSVPEAVAEHTAMFEELFGSETDLLSHLQSEAAQRAGGNPDLVTDKTNDAFQTYVDEADAAELADLFQGVDLDDIDPEQASLHPTYAQDVVSASRSAAEQLLSTEYGLDLDIDVSAVYDNRYPGGSFDWKANTVRIGTAPNHLSFTPSLLGIMVHELAHVHQFQEKVADGVARYNALVADSGIDGFDQVTPDDDQYLEHGAMMAAEGDRIATLFDIVAGTDDATGAYEQHLDAAIETELERAAIDPSSPWEPFEKNTLTQLFSPTEEALPHLLYLDATGELDRERIDRYVEEIVSTYDGAGHIRDEMRRLRRGDDLLFPGSGAKGADGYRDAVAMLEDAGIDVEEPYPGNVFFHPRDLAAGDTEAEYVRGTDAIVTYIDDERLYPSTLSHELIHYAQVHRALGDPADAFHESLALLRDTVQDARDTLGDAFIDEELLSGPHLATNRDVNVASALYEFTGDLETVYDETVGADGDVDDFLAVLEDPELRDDERQREAMGPIAARAQNVNKLPLDSYGEADAMFWSLYGACRNAYDEVGAEQLFEKLYQHWDDERPSLAESLLHYDTEDASYSQAILDGIEARIATYDRLTQDGLAQDEAASTIINNGLDRFERLGDTIHAYEGGAR